MWNTQRVNDLTEKVNSGMTLKQLVRDISIDTILDDFNNSPQFPFFLSRKGERKINPKLRNSNLKFEFNEEEIKTFFSFKNNPIELFRYIKKCEIFPHEEQYINAYHKNRFNLINSPLKQIRFTQSLISTIVLHYSIYENGKSIIIYTSKNTSCDPSSKNFSEHYLLKMYESLPFYLKPGIIILNYDQNLFEILFDNGNRIIVTDYTQNVIGGNFDFIISDGSQDIISLIPSFLMSFALRDTMILINSDEINFEKLNYLNPILNNFIKLDLYPIILPIIREEKINSLEDLYILNESLKNI